MVIIRTSAGNASARRVLLLVAELWVVFTLWIVIFRAIAGAVGTPAGGGVGEVRELGSRLWSLHGQARMWAIAGLAFSVLLAAHFMWALRKMMGEGATQE